MLVFCVSLLLMYISTDSTKPYFSMSTPTSATIFSTDVLLSSWLGLFTEQYAYCMFIQASCIFIVCCKKQRKTPKTLDIEKLKGHRNRKLFFLEIVSEKVKSRLCIWACCRKQQLSRNDLRSVFLLEECFLIWGVFGNPTSWFQEHESRIHTAWERRTEAL